MGQPQGAGMVWHKSAAAAYVLIAAPSAVAGLLLTVAVGAEMYPEPSHLTRGEAVRAAVSLAWVVSVVGTHASVAWGLWRGERWAAMLGVVVAALEAVGTTAAHLWFHGFTEDERVLGYGREVVSVWVWSLLPLWVTLPLFLGVGALTLSLRRRSR